MAANQTPALFGQRPDLGVTKVRQVTASTRVAVVTVQRHDPAP
jgi:hypothetical protein